MIKNRQFESLSDSSSAEKRFSQTVMDERMQYNVNTNIQFLNTRACPLSLGFEHSTSGTLDVHILNSQRRLQVYFLEIN
jgi:hypothetical protein